MFSRKEFVVAAQNSDKTKTQGKKGGMMGMLSKVFGVGAITLGALFFAAMFDVGHAGLIHTLAGSAIVLVPLFALFAIAAMFIAPKSGADLEEMSAQVAALTEAKSKMTSQILTLQNHMDSMSGQDVETLKAKNQELQEQLDAIHQAEREKMDGEVDTLRQRNEELEAQIKQWALETISKNVGSNKPAAAKAA
jgi:gas vesicle protein